MQTAERSSRPAPRPGQEAGNLKAGSTSSTQASAAEGSPGRPAQHQERKRLRRHQNMQRRNLAAHTWLTALGSFILAQSGTGSRSLLQDSILRHVSQREKLDRREPPLWATGHHQVPKESAHGSHQQPGNLRSRQQREGARSHRQNEATRPERRRTRKSPTARQSEVPAATGKSPQPPPERSRST